LYIEHVQGKLEVAEKEKKLRHVQHIVAEGMIV
jgi:hypothetical protein